MTDPISLSKRSRVDLERINALANKYATTDGDVLRWILGVGDPCGRDPHYTPARGCLAEQRALRTPDKPSEA